MLRGLSNLSLRRPSDDDMAGTLGTRDEATYAGLSQRGPPLPGEAKVSGFVEDYDAYKVGKGRKTFKAASEALRKWEHLQLGWVISNHPPVGIGSGLCIAARLLFLWLRNPLSVVYQGKTNRGLVPRFVGSHCRSLPAARCPGHRLWLGATCLKGHVLAGEERWAVQWQKNDDSVWYEIYAFSKPDSLLAWIAYPVCRYYQMKFRRDSAKKMLEALQSGSSNE
eukprot:jgi/Botrbrau1/13134/Bobra.0187s0089.1